MALATVNGVMCGEWQPGNKTDPNFRSALQHYAELQNLTERVDSGNNPGLTYDLLNVSTKAVYGDRYRGMMFKITLFITNTFDRNSVSWCTIIPAECECDVIVFRDDELMTEDYDENEVLWNGCEGLIRPWINVVERRRYGSYLPSVTSSLFRGVVSEGYVGFIVEEHFGCDITDSNCPMCFQLELARIQYINIRGNQIYEVGFTNTTSNEFCCITYGCTRQHEQLQLKYDTCITTQNGGKTY